MSTPEDVLEMGLRVKWPESIPSFAYLEAITFMLQVGGLLAPGRARTRRTKNAAEKQSMEARPKEAGPVDTERVAAALRALPPGRYSAKELRQMFNATHWEPRKALRRVGLKTTGQTSAVRYVVGAK